LDSLANQLGRWLSKSVLSEILQDALPIEATESCKTFEVYGKHYVAYLVIGCGEYKDEAYTGEILRHYTKSHFLDHLNRDTGGHFKYGF
jgi:hypothetical protein